MRDVQIISWVMSHVTSWREQTAKMDKVAEGLRTFRTTVVDIEQCEAGDLFVILEFEFLAR